ncbi:30S ribosome-binding factor RbfA [Thiotrichales bacterium 19X7-9]|nr:30S ribosome-binding factor RbfA [Thiotrichales bacterium 19X7-9]
MAGTSRVYRVADEIQRLIVTAIRKKIRNPKFQWVSITSVDVSKDLSYAKIYYTSLSETVSQTDLAEAFNKAKGFFRSYLAKELSLRIVPNLRFIYDDSLEYGSEMSKLIDSARKADEAFIDKSETLENDEQTDSEKDDKKDKRKRLR